MHVSVTSRSNSICIRPQATNPPLIVYVHGGAWRAGSKSDVPIAKLLDQGFAIASVDYRLSTQAVFPAQIHDIKAAIRFPAGESRSCFTSTPHALPSSVHPPAVIWRRWWGYEWE
jgi:hypothetical protein